MTNRTKHTKSENALKHTPEPWKVSQPWAGFSEIRGGGGELVFGLAAGHDDERQPSDVCEANARRLEACVNALAGIENPEQSLRELVLAARKAENFIANTECELGIKLDSGQMLRASLAPFKDIA